MEKNQRKKGNSRACCGSLGKKVASICVMAMGGERSTWTQGTFTTLGFLWM